MFKTFFYPSSKTRMSHGFLMHKIEKLPINYTRVEMKE